MGGVVAERAPAKINLHLRILARAPDGYHDLDTIFQALELHDTLEVEIAPVTALEVEGGVDVGPVADNLVLRADCAFREAVPGAPHARIRLIKRIPAGAGLGGGSSDAAATLRALNHLAGSPLSLGALRNIGQKLGSDVAFFLCGAPRARGQGRGERLAPLRALSPAHVVVVDPGFPVSTRQAFAWWDETHAEASRDDGPAESGLRPSIASRASDASWASLAAAARNDFEEPVFARHPELGEIADRLRRAGAILAMLSGSGSCVFGIFDDRAAADEAERLVLKSMPDARVLLTRTAE